MDNSKKLNQLLQNREYLFLKGKNRILLLIIILLLTFISLGHVFEGIKQLKISMENPFTNWVDVSNQYEGETNKLVGDLEQFKDSFHIVNIVPYFRPKHSIVKRDLSTINIKNRSIKTDDPLISMIFSEENILFSHAENSDFLSMFKKCGVVVSENFIRKIGFDRYDEIKEIVYSYEYLPSEAGDFDTHFKIPIICVVRELPNEVDFVMEDRFYMRYQSDKVLVDESISSIYMRVLIDPSLNVETIDESFIDEIIFQDEVFLYDKQYNYYEILMKEPLGKVPRGKLREKFISKYNRKIIAYDELSCSNTNSTDVLPVDYYAYNFKSLENIKEFSSFALLNYGIEISLKQVESKQNFFVVARIALLFIFILIIACITSILLFLNNVLKNHLESIKPNLGTLKAFGMDNGAIQLIYYKIILKFFFLGSGIAFFISCLYHFIFNYFNIKGWYFNIFDLYIFILWIIILISIGIFFYFSIRKILSKTAGDLIYNR